MASLPDTLSSWGSPAFEAAFKKEAAALGASVLPLQQGLTHGSYAIDRVDAVTLLSVTEVGDRLEIRAGLHYAGIIAGCSCADDPTPNNETVEHCDILVVLDRQSAEASISLLA